ncbi:MAG: TonB-dependent receptor [Flavobacteriales bacterium]|nr:TonB-dependent receptor [Flavobacteriales bacterium]
MRYWLIIFIFFSVQLYSQQKGVFKGTVKEGDEVIIGANVQMLEDKSKGASTNFDGEFAFECPVGVHRFVVSFVGLKPDTIEVEILADEIVTRNIELYEDSELLRAVDVKVGKFDKDIKDMTISMEVIRPALIENKNTRSIETVLDQTPGLNIMDGEPQIRGGSGFTFGVGSKVAVLVDDMPMLSGDAGRPEWGFIPVENIDQVEVIKGAASVLSGASALSGAIHIKTAEPGVKPLTKINVYSGFYSEPQNDSALWWNDYPYIHGANFLHTRKIRQLDLTVGGLVNFDHGYLGSPRPGEFVVDTITNFTDDQMKSQKGRVNLGLRYHPKKAERLTFGLNANAMYNSTNLTLAWLDDTNGIYRAYPGGVILQKQTIFNVDPYLNYFSKNGMKHSIKTRWLSTSNEMSANQSNFSDVYFADYQFKHTFKKFNDLEVIAGASTSQTYSFSQIFVASGDSTNTLQNYSGYVQVDKKLFERINLSFGFRGEGYILNDTINNGATIFRGGLNYKLTEGTNFRMSYGQGYRYPTIAERFIRTKVGTFGVFANPDLKPETSWNVEAGFRQGYKFGPLKGYIDVAVFKQHYENTIEYLFGFWDPTFQFAVAGFKFLNTGASQVVGLDVSMAGKFENKKKSTVTYILGYNYILPTTLEPDQVFAEDYRPGGNGEFSYNTTSFDSSNRILKYRFLHTFKADVEYTFREKLAIGGSARYFSKIENLDRAIIDFEEVTVNSGGSLQGIRYIDFYQNHNTGNLIFDARISYTFIKKYKAAIIVSNVTNKTYSLRPLKVEPLRTVMLQLSAKF